MSFSQNVKKEIITLDDAPLVLKAEAYAMTKLKAETVVSNRMLTFVFHTSSVFLARRITFLFKKLYDISSELMVKEVPNLKLKRVYHVTIKDKARFILEDLGIIDADMNPMDDIDSQYVENKEALLRGMFLAKGSINDPNKSNYHLEIVCQVPEEARFVIDTLFEYGIEAKQVIRRKGIVVYIKKGEHIGDFLKLIGATNMLFYFENERIKRDLNNVVNRVLNCDMANGDRAQASSQKQLRAIKQIEQHRGYQFLSNRLMEAVILRTTYPEYSLSELSEVSEELVGRYITKSGISHCLNDLVAIAHGIDEERKNA